VLKADTQGSVEVLTGMLQKLSTDKVRVRIIHSATGAIGETDVLLASASNGIVVGFNVRPEPKARELAAKEEVDIRLHTIIYNITSELEAAMDGLLEPTYEEVSLGRAEVRQIFRIPKVGVIAGSYVTEGKITRDAQVRILRDNVVVFEGKLASLRRVKDDASEVRKDYECGIGIANYQDIKEGDVFEAYQIKRVEATKK
jgi:translation initiation factor IF-2